MSSPWDMDAWLENSLKYMIKNPLPCFVVLIAVHIGFYFLLRSQPPSLWKFRDLKISEIYIYPIKSLRGVSVPQATATDHGFQHDRRFMLLRVTEKGLENMQVSKYAEMTRFTTSITFPEENPENSKSNQGSINVEYSSPESSKISSLTIPLRPDTTSLEPISVDLYSSVTKAYQMPSEFNSWFSSHFDFDVILAYQGENLRDVLFKDLAPPKKKSWIPGMPGHRITFADCAPYLFTSKTSLADVSARLPDGEDMDMTKFRPNVVLEGAESAWEEDFWARLEINGAEIIAAHNCGRCTSINIDYSTGKPGKGESGSVLKKLQADRRIDLGLRYSAIFGRYCFWNAKNGEKVLKVGDQAKVTRFNPKPTIWNWDWDGFGPKTSSWLLAFKKIF